MTPTPLERTEVREFRRPRARFLCHFSVSGEAIGTALALGVAAWIAGVPLVVTLLVPLGMILLDASRRP